MVILSNSNVSPQMVGSIETMYYLFIFLIAIWPTVNA